MASAAERISTARTSALAFPILTLWIGLDEFGRTIVEHLAQTVPPSKDYRLLSISPPPDKPLPPNVATLAGFDAGQRDAIVAALQELLNLDPVQPTQRTVQPHLWLACDLDSVEAEHIPSWIGETVTYCKSALRLPNLRLFLLVRFQTWPRPSADHSTDGRAARITGSLVDELLGPGKPGHGLTTVFVVTDRKENRSYVPAEIQQATAAHFAAFALMTGAPQSTVPGVREAFGAPDPAPPRLVDSDGDGETSDVLSSPPAAKTPGKEPAREMPPIMPGPFTAVGARVLVYPSHEIWAARLAGLLPPLYAVLVAPAPAVWPLAPPTIERQVVTPESIDDIVESLPAPVWKPDLWLAWEREHSTVMRQVQRWLTAAETWRQAELEKLTANRAMIARISQELQASYWNKLADQEREAWTGEFPGGPFDLLRLHLNQCLESISIVRTDLDTALAASPEMDADDPLATAPAEEIVRLAPPLRADDTRLDRIEHTLAGAIGQRPNQAIQTAVAIVAAFFLWVLGVRAIELIERTWLAAFDGMLKLAPAALDRRLISLRDWLLIDALHLWGLIGLCVLSAVLFLVQRARQRATKPLIAAFDRFREEINIWHEDAVRLFARALPSYEAREARETFDALIAGLECRQAQLATFWQWGTSDSATSPDWQPPDGCSVALDFQLASPRQLSRAEIDEIVRRFGQTPMALAWADHAPKTFFTLLLETAAAFAGDQRPRLNHDLPALGGDIAEKLPTAADALIYPIRVPDQQLPTSWALLLGVPSGLEGASTLKRFNRPLLPIPSDDRIYAIVLRSGYAQPHLFPNDRSAVSTKRAETS